VYSGRTPTPPSTVRSKSSAAPTLQATLPSSLVVRKPISARASGRFLLAAPRGAALAYYQQHHRLQRLAVGFRQPHSQAAQGQTVVVIDRAGENLSPAPQQVVPLFQHQTSHVARSHTSCRTGNARSSCWQRLQASRIDRLSALGASPICAVGYSLQGGFNLMDFGGLSLAYNFECFLIFKFNCSSESAASNLCNSRSTFATCVRSSERRAFSAFSIFSSFSSHPIALKGVVPINYPVTTESHWVRTV
jgi:hypothetical protein